MPDCDCLLHRERHYGAPSAHGRSHPTEHHYVAERFFGRSKNRRNEVREDISPDVRRTAACCSSQKRGEWITFRIAQAKNCLYRAHGLIRLTPGLRNKSLGEIGLGWASARFPELGPPNGME